LTYTSLATSLAPCFDMDRNTRSPPLSMNVTSSRFTMHLRPWAARCAFLQLVFNSVTQGATRRPCKVHRSTASVLVIVIFSISSFSPIQSQCKCRARGFDIRRARSISRCLSQQPVGVKSKGNSRNSERMRLSQTSDTCREKCQNLRHPAHCTVASESRVPCLQSVAVVSPRTRLWQRRCTVPGCESDRLSEDRLFSPNRSPACFGAVGGAIVADAAGTAFLAGSA
jgi:hypothetical protein